jgi:hypothetical protein
MSFPEHREDSPSARPSAFRRATGWTLVAALVVLTATRLYTRFTTGYDPGNWIFGIVLFDELPIAVPISVGFVALALLVNWSEIRESRNLRIKPFLVFAIVIALALLGWVKSNDI